MQRVVARIALEVNCKIIALGLYFTQQVHYGNAWQECNELLLEMHWECKCAWSECNNWLLLEMQVQSKCSIHTHFHNGHSKAEKIIIAVNIGFQGFRFRISRGL